MLNTSQPQPSGAQSYQQRTEGVCEQLRRYGGGVYDTDLLAALEALEDVNDALWNAHAVHFIYAGIDAAIASLSTLRAKTQLQAAGKAGA